MAHTRVYPMDSQRYDMTKRTGRRTRLSSNIVAPAPISFTFVDRYPVFSRIDSQRFDPLGRPTTRRARRSSLLSSNLKPSAPLPAVAKITRKPSGIFSRMDSQRFDPTLKSKPLYNLNLNTPLPVQQYPVRVTDRPLVSSPESMIRESDNGSTITDLSLIGTSRDGIFESRSNFAMSSSTSLSMISDTSTPWRIENPNDNPQLASDNANANINANQLEEGLKVHTDGQRRALYILETQPPCTNFLCGLDCRNSTLTAFDVVHPLQSSNHVSVPAVIRLP